MLTDVEVAWLAGLFEGEGSFNTNANEPSRKGRPSICAEILMTDRDVIERAGRMIYVETGKLPNVYVRKSDGVRKLAYRVRVRGQAAEDLMRVVYRYMGQRRRAKIDELLSTTDLSHTPRN